ncbi:hypothetical protein NC651_000051 [Populus alba x Populus x berolinensis]|nr:hypothetical protein NC651_000051 [Populus alba x Populus x berolinensis]
MALEQQLSLTTTQNPVDGERTNGVDTNIRDGGDDGNKAPRLPRWTRQEILVLIQGKRVAENRVRRGRASGMGIGSDKSNRNGPLGIFLLQKTWSEPRTGSVSEKMEEVYDILDGGGGTVPGLALALAPSSTAAEAVAEEEEGGGSPEAVVKEVQPIKMAVTAGVANPTTDFSSLFCFLLCTEKQYQPAPRASQAQDGGLASHEERKRKRFAIDGDEETISLQGHLIDVLERNGKMLSAQLEAQNTNFQLDREQRKDHADGLVAVLNKLANALGKIADKL